MLYLIFRLFYLALGHQKIGYIHRTRVFHLIVLRKAWRRLCIIGMKWVNNIWMLEDQLLHSEYPILKKEHTFENWIFRMKQLIFQHPNIIDRKSTRLNYSHVAISYAVFCLKKKNVVMVLESGATSVGSFRSCSASSASTAENTIMHSY